MKRLALALAIVMTHLGAVTNMTLVSAETNPRRAMATTPSAAAALDVKTDLDTFLSKIAKADLLVGSVLIAKDGQLVLSKAYGMANLELDVPNSPQTKYRIGSITKQFTALSILQLQQAGKLNVKDPICTYIVTCPKAWQAITIHQLLTHTSGIRNFTALDDYPDFKRIRQTPQSLINRITDFPLDFKAGERWEYSNSNYLLLGAIIEKVSGQPYATYLRTHVLEPANLKDSGIEGATGLLKNRASGYTNFTNNADFIDMSVLYAAGAMYSTTEDLWRWSETFYGEKLLSANLLAEMTKPHVKVESASQAVSYGYGVTVDNTLGHRRIGHSGGLEGFRTELDWFPDDRVTIVVLCNRENIDPNEIADILAEKIFTIN